MNVASLYQRKVKYGDNHVPLIAGVKELEEENKPLKKVSTNERLETKIVAASSFH
jgi:hypothetical protein